MKTRFRILLGILLLTFGEVGAQDEDDRSNLTKYTPSLLLSKGQTEVKVFNNLYTQTSFYDSETKKQELDERGTYFTAINQVLYGISPRVNIGYMLFFRSVRLDDAKSNPLSIFRFEKDLSSRTAVSFAGPTVRVSPFANNKHFSFQSTFLFPLVSDQEGAKSGGPFLDFDKHYWWTQFFYDKVLANNFVLFLEADLIVRIDKSEPFKQSFIYNPLKVFFGRFMGRNWGIYVMTEWTPFWGDKDLLAAYYVQAGSGVKVQVSKKLELEAAYTLFPSGKNTGAGQTYNLGLRFLW
ncbi:MAG: hypothetical protein JKY52_11525 [Flavobacteriales bacterium]|nr:hypothetical protein [Flavobacteriales bacterium]